jgi:hypothetical protein
MEAFRGMEPDESKVDPWTARYPTADITPAEFEQFVADVLATGAPGLEGYRVTAHETVKGVDGMYDFDATARFRLHGMDFLVVVEAKFHSNPIKRELVQVLHSKAVSVGAHKALLVATAPFQRGAINYAKTHGIALVTVTEGRFTLETRGAAHPPPLSRERAAELYGLPTFTGVYIGPGDAEDSEMMAVVGADTPERVRELLLAVPAKP